jgi:hypothetical protein
LSDSFIIEGENSTSPVSVLVVGNGAASVVVPFGFLDCKTPQEAKAWMGTSQYSQLKALLTSVRYV